MTFRELLAFLNPTLDGTEEKEDDAAYFFDSLSVRIWMRVRVYKPAKSAAQSGRARSNEWLVEPEIVTARAPEPIMGWSSAGDTYGELKGRLRFPSLDDALSFARSKGWEVLVEEPTERRITPRNYLDNFRIRRPQDEERT